MYAKLNTLLCNLDAVLITSPHNMRYFSGFSGGEGAVLILSGERCLFTDSRYTEAAKREAPDFEIIETSSYIASACEKLKAFGASSVAIEDLYMSVRSLSEAKKVLGSIETVMSSNDIEALRMVKTDAELEKMQKAQQIAVSAFRHTLKFIKAGISERDIALEMEYCMRKSGAEGISFETIAVSGKNSSLPHGTPSAKRIENGDFLTIDFGCKFGGYCSDMTRTVVVGKASAKQREIYETVKKAQQTGLEAIREGVLASSCDKAARQVIENAGYGKYFGHSLGHGVGLLIHELPNLSPRCDITLLENMTVTCEPGIYIPDFGGVRIEDMVCVKKGGLHNFTEETHDLIEL